MTVRLHWGLLVVASSALTAIAGCVSDGPSEPRKPRLPPQPRDAHADVVLLNLAQPTDSDGDTAPDSLVASVHLFDERYQLPVRVEGTVTFELLSPSRDEPLYMWTFAGSDLRTRIIQAQVGPVYRFRLDVPRREGPVIERIVDIRCTFEDTQGRESVAWHRGLTWDSRAR